MTLQLGYCTKAPRKLIPTKGPSFVSTIDQIWALEYRHQFSCPDPVTQMLPLVNWKVNPYLPVVNVYKNKHSLIARFMGPTWGPSGAERTQVGPMLAPWTLLSGLCWMVFFCIFGSWIFICKFVIIMEFIFAAIQLLTTQLLQRFAHGQLL